MPEIKLDALSLTKRHSLTVSYSRKAKRWWAVIWLDEAGIAVETADGGTPIEALGELLARAGVAISDVN